jgi:replication-associated recombination protein RarA
MNELIARCAGLFTPKSADDFVGNNIVARQSGDQTGARLVAQQIAKAVNLANQNDRTPLKFLFNGKPGLGKSALVQYLQHLTGCNKWSTTKLNGTECKMERIELLAEGLHYKNLFGGWRMVWIDEADEIPRVAQVRFLTLLDDLPQGVIVACTSNCSLSDFENRFQTRFQAFEIAPPPPLDIQNLLVRIAPQISPHAAGQIANFACGNVRQALLDAQGALQQLASVTLDSNVKETPCGATPLR